MNQINTFNSRIKCAVSIFKDKTVWYSCFIDRLSFQTNSKSIAKTAFLLLRNRKKEGVFDAEFDAKPALPAHQNTRTRGGFCTEARTSFSEDESASHRVGSVVSCSNCEPGSSRTASATHAPTRPTPKIRSTHEERRSSLTPFCSTARRDCDRR